MSSADPRPHDGEAPAANDPMLVDTAFGRTSRLGVGMATLMREPNRRRRAAVLEGAWEAGYRHFDVAPLYGVGTAEADLGAFLAGRSGFTVISKSGLLPTRKQLALRPLQAPVRTIARRVPGARSIVQRLAGTPAPAGEPTPEELATSAAGSAERLGVAALSALLTHELPWTPGLADALDAFRAAPDRHARTAGVAVSEADLPGYPASMLAAVPVLQGPSSVLPRIPRGGGTVVVFAAMASRAAVQAWCGTPEGRASALVRRLTELGDAASVAAGVVAYAHLVERPDSVVLVGSTSARHLASTWRMCAAGFTEGLDAPAAVRRILWPDADR